MFYSIFYEKEKSKHHDTISQEQLFIVRSWMRQLLRDVNGSSYVT